MHIFDLGCDVLGVIFLNHDLYFVHHVIMHVCKKFNRSINNLYYIEIYKKHLLGRYPKCVFNLQHITRHKQIHDYIGDHHKTFVNLKSNEYVDAKKIYHKSYSFLKKQLCCYDIGYLFDVYPWLVNSIIFAYSTNNIVISLERVKRALCYKPNGYIYRTLFKSHNLQIIEHLFETLEQCDDDMTGYLSDIFRNYIVARNMLINIYVKYSHKWRIDDSIVYLYSFGYFDVIKTLMSKSINIRPILGSIFGHGRSDLLACAYDGYRSVINTYLENNLHRVQISKEMAKIIIRNGYTGSMYSNSYVMGEIVKKCSYDREYLVDIAVLFK